MSEASSMSDPTICADSRSVISSPGSASGLMPCAAPDGPMTDLFGQALAPVSRSAPPAKAMSSQMSATYGRLGSGSSASADLSLSLANRFQARTRSLGSTLFRLTWKARVTPSGRSIPALRASALPTSDSDFTSWPTTNTRGAASAGRYSVTTGVMHPGTTLTDAARMATWNCTEDRNRYDQLPRQAQLTDSGATSSGSPAATAKRGQLNPALSRWLMGLPPEWCDCAATETRSVLLKRRRSSKPTWTRAVESDAAMKGLG